MPVSDPDQCTFQSQAMDCLQLAVEAHMVNVFEDSALCTIHRKKVTTTEMDMRLAQRLASSERGPLICK